MKLKDLFEARSNANLNPKISAYNAFYMHANKPNMYVSYTMLEKLGVNPQTKYNTPVGIYSYPLRYVLDRADRIGSLAGAAPFASTHRYAHLFQQTSNNVLRLESYNKFQTDSVKVYEYFTKHFGLGQAGVDRIRTVAENELRKERTQGGKIWRLVYLFLDHYATTQREKAVQATIVFYRVLGYDAVTDDTGMGIIHPGEPVQAVHFDKRTLRVLDVYRNSNTNKTEETARREIADPAGLYNRFQAQATKMKDGSVSLMKSVYKFPTRFDSIDDVRSHTKSLFDNARNFVRLIDSFVEMIQRNENQVELVRVVSSDDIEKIFNLVKPVIVMPMEAFVTNFIKIHTPNNAMRLHEDVEKAFVNYLRNPSTPTSRFLTEMENVSRNLSNIITMSEKRSEISLIEKYRTVTGRVA